MRLMVYTGSLVIFLCVSGVISADSLPGTLKLGPDRIALGFINGKTVRYQVEANGTSTLLLNPAAAVRLDVKPGLIGIGVRVKVSPTAIDGRTASIRYSVDKQTIKRRVAWFSRAIAPDVDGVLGPTAVPQSVVVFQLREPEAGERTVALPMVDRGYQGAGTDMFVGGSLLFVQWDLERAASMATAAGAADLAAANHGAFSGPTWQESIRFGVERPVRRLVLKSPLLVGPVRISELIARVSDYGDTSKIPDADADENEIIVIAKGHKDRAVHHLLIGRDDMAACSQIRFDKVRRQVTLTCRSTP